MEFKQLAAFISVAQHLSFSRAAQNLSVTQSTISKYIKALEEELGVSLFVRDQTLLQITQEGKIFWPEAEKILRISEKAKNVIKQSDTNITFNIGFVPLSMFSFLPKFIENVKQKFPQVQIKLKTYYDCHQLLEHLHTQKLDVAFYNQTESLTNIQSVLMDEQDIMAIQSVNSPFAELEEITAKQAPLLRYILPPKEASPYLMNYFFNLCRLLKFEPDIAFCVQDHQARLALTVQGLGVMMDSEVIKKLNTPRVVFTPLHKNLACKSRIFMGWYVKHKQREILQLLSESFEGKC